jgi:hypothetical protein
MIERAPSGNPGQLTGDGNDVFRNYFDERTGPMKRSKFSEEQIVYAIRQADGDLCLIPLTIAGGDVLHAFVLALLLGVLIGTYASTVVETPFSYSGRALDSLHHEDNRMLHIAINPSLHT